MAKNNIFNDISDILVDGTTKAIEPFVTAEASARGDVRRNIRDIDKFLVDSKPTIKKYISCEARANRKAKEVDDYEAAIKEALKDGEEDTARALLEECYRVSDMAASYADLCQVSKPVVEGIFRVYSTLTDIYEDSRETAEYAEFYADTTKLIRAANKTIKRNGGSLKSAKERNNSLKDKAVSELGAENFEFRLRTEMERGEERKEYYLKRARAKKADQYLEEIKASMNGTKISASDALEKAGSDE